MTTSYSFMYINMILSLLLFVASILIPTFLVLTSPPTSRWHDIPELLMKYALFFNVGCLFFTGFMGQMMHAPDIAALLGWGWSPFQYELAFSELGLAILGLMSPLFEAQFWLATIICATVWLLGGSGVHLYYLWSVGNRDIINASFVIGWNIFIALWLIGLFIFVIYSRLRKESLVDIAELELEIETRQQDY